MKLRIAVMMAMGILGLLVFAGESFAQPPVRAAKPTLSPYLNLLRPQGDLAFRYYQGVLQQRAFENAVRRQTQSVNLLKRQVRELEKPAPISAASRLGQTGHPTRFQSYGGSFGRAGFSPNSRSPIR